MKSVRNEGAQGLSEKGLQSGPLDDECPRLVYTLTFPTLYLSFPQLYSKEGTADVAISQLNSNKLKKSSKFIIFPSLDSEVALPKTNRFPSEQSL